MKHTVKGKAGFDANKLFLIDGVGALLSAFLLAVVLVQLESYFGIPPFDFVFPGRVPGDFCHL